MEELIAFVGYVLTQTKDPVIRKRAAVLLSKYYKLPGDSRKQG